MESPCTQEGNEFLEWAERHNLPEELIGTIQEAGFGSEKQLSELSPAYVDKLEKDGKIAEAQGIILKKLIRQRSEYSGSQLSPPSDTNTSAAAPRLHEGLVSKSAFPPKPPPKPKKKDARPLTSPFRQSLLRTVKRLKKYAPEEYERVDNLTGSSPAFFTPVYQLSKKTCGAIDGGERPGPYNRLMKCAHHDHYKKILKIIEELAGKENSLWISDTLYADFNLPMDIPSPGYLTFQLLFLGEYLPCFVLTLYEGEGVTQQEARRFSARISQLLTLSLVRFCHCDFVLLPCALLLSDLTKVTLEKEVESQMKKSSDYYEGPQWLAPFMYKEMTRAVTAVWSATNIPCLLQNLQSSAEGLCNWLTLMDREWCNAMSLFVEALANCDSDSVALCWTEDTKYKIKVAALEAASRFGRVESVMFETTDVVLAQTRMDQTKAKRLTVKTADKALDVNIRITTSQCRLTISDECFRLLILGKTGNGKSSSGNTIFEEDVFLTGIAFDSKTKAPHFARRKKNGTIIEIVDCPGLCDTNDDVDVHVGIVNAVACTHPGAHAILYVVRVDGRYTEEEFSVYKKLKVLFDEHITKHMIVLFTRGDCLEPEQNLEDLIEKAPKNFRQVLKECGGRYVLFNNVAENKGQQVEELLTAVRELKMQNDDKLYVCHKYKDIGEALENMVAKRLKCASEGGLSERSQIGANRNLAEEEALSKIEPGRKLSEMEETQPGHMYKEQDHMEQQSSKEHRKSEEKEVQPLKMTPEQTAEQNDGSDRQDLETIMIQTKTEISKTEKSFKYVLELWGRDVPEIYFSEIPDSNQVAAETQEPITLCTGDQHDFDMEQ